MQYSSVAQPFDTHGTLNIVEELWIMVYGIDWPQNVLQINTN